MINSTLLFRLAAVNRHGSVRRAAAELNLSQPALSQSIRELEALVGMPLFERTARGLAITPAGQRLCIHADIVNDEIRRTADTARHLRAGTSGTFAIGASASIAASALPGVTDSLIEEGLVQAALIHEGMAGPLTERLMQGSLDVVVTYLWNEACAEPSLLFETVGVSELGLVCSAETASDVRQRGISVLLQARWVAMTKSLEMKQRLENFLASVGGRRPDVVESDSITFALNLLQHHDYVAFLPLGHTGVLDAGRFVHLDVAGITWARAVGVFYRRRAHQPAALPRMIDMLRAFYADPASSRLPKVQMNAG